MDWKIEAIDKLKQYEAKRQALKNIPLEIAQIEATMTGIRSAKTDGISARSSKGNAHEDKLLSCIVRRAEMQRNLECAELYVRSVDSALEILNSEKRKILERMYICSMKKAADSLAEELYVDLKTVYRRKDDALRKFTVALYGVEIS